MSSIVGLLFWHRDHGYCKVVSVAVGNRSFQVEFCGSSLRLNFAVSALQRELLRKPLPVDSIGHVEGKGKCRVVKGPVKFVLDAINNYVVQFDDGEIASVSEDVLEPADARPKETLFSRLANFDAHSSLKYLARRDLVACLDRMRRISDDASVMLGSRIDLFPHQAFVVRTILTDPLRRFILADEVGLGKTVEAGLVVGSVLASKPDARILVLAPGSLCRQWLCELHSSFGGYGFRLLDLYKSTMPQSWRRVICSTRRAAYHEVKQLLECGQWDLVVVDEAHHLLSSLRSYGLIETLAKTCGGLLLLSAVPARARESDLLRLLRLIDPQKYAAGDLGEERFLELYRSQSTIGRGLRVFDRDIQAIENGEASVDELGLPIKMLQKSSAISSDAGIQESFKQLLALEVFEAVQVAKQIRKDIVDRYRLSRRIIKNRRGQLVAKEYMAQVTRKYFACPYEPDAFELEVDEVLSALFESLATHSIPDSVLRCFFRLAFISMTDPVCLSLLVEELRECAEGERNVPWDAELAASMESSYDDYYALSELVCSQVARFVDPAQRNRLSNSVNGWLDVPRMKSRLFRLFEILAPLLDDKKKVVIFAGAIGSARSLVEDLRKRLGSDVVELFAFDLSDEAKETSVLTFKTKVECQILVSDESGGEGRNFQFADSLVHYDLPWSIAALEQRVGRLDRIGRNQDVPSYVLFRRQSVEEAFALAAADGFKVFSQSISGLEFLLKEIECRLLDLALRGDHEGLGAAVKEIAVTADLERQSDDADALTDAAAFAGEAAVIGSEDWAGLEVSLEGAFVAYFRGMATSGSARTVVDDRDASLRLWCLKPDEIRGEPLQIEKKIESSFAERRGTFRRRVARNRRDLEFFTVGHDLFDAVVGCVDTRISGRTFAVRAAANDVEGMFLSVQVGFEAVDMRSVAGTGVAKRLERYFRSKRLRVNYRVGDLNRISDVPTNAALERLLADRESLQDLSTTLFRQGIEKTTDSWSEFVAELKEVVTRHAILEYRNRFDFDHKVFKESIEGERARVAQSPSASLADSAQYEKIIEMLDRWTATVDSIGYIEICK